MLSRRLICAGFPHHAFSRIERLIARIRFQANTIAVPYGAWSVHPERSLPSAWLPVAFSDQPWQVFRLATPISRLELRAIRIPRSPPIGLLEQHAGKEMTHEQRHYLADAPVHCGDLLELYLEGQWVTGRCEWTGRPEDPPTFHTEDAAKRLDDQSLLRWPRP